MFADGAAFAFIDAELLLFAEIFFQNFPVHLKCPVLRGDLPVLHIRIGAADAGLADFPDQPLRHDGIDGRRNQKRLDSHIRQPRQRGRGVIGMQG